MAKADKPSAGFDDPRISITSKTYEPGFVDEEAKQIGPNVWTIGAIIAAADGTRMTTERFVGELSPDAEDDEIEAAIAKRWGI